MRAQIDQTQAKVKTTISSVLKQKLLVIFFNLKKTWRFRAAPDGIPSGIKLKPYEGDLDMTYNVFSGPHMG